MPPPRPPSGGATPMSASKVHKKERILHALTRMNDRDTQKAAAEDLLSIIRHLDAEGLPILLSCLCTTGTDQKVYARKECARALGVLASEVCPLRDKALQPPHLAKMLGQLRKSLQDPDSSVREASSEALALAAQGLAHCAVAAGAELPGGGLGNPVVKLLSECLVEQKKDLNAAACAALGMAAPFLGTLDPPVAKDLVRRLASPAFQAPAALAAALARTDPVSGEPLGLVKSGPAAFMPLLPSLVGQPPALGGTTPPPPASGGSGSGGGSGLVGLLSRPDWQTRLAAADALRAASLLLGPLLEPEGCWAPGEARCLSGRAQRGLEACKFDKVREVRDVARAALAVVEELQGYGAGGGNAADWPEFISGQLLARGHLAPALSVPAATPPPAATPAATPPPPSAQGSAVDVYATPPLISGPSAPQLGTPAASAGIVAPSRRSPLRRSSPSVIPGRRPPSGASPLRQRSPTPLGGGPPSPSRARSPVFERQGSLADRFRAAHKDNDSVADPLARYQDQDLGGAAPGPSPQLFQDLPPGPDAVPPGSEAGPPGSEAGAAAAAVPGPGSVVAGGPGPGSVAAGPAGDGAPGSRVLSRNPSQASRAGPGGVEPQFAVRDGAAPGGAEGGADGGPPPAGSASQAGGGPPAFSRQGSAASRAGGLPPGPLPAGPLPPGLPRSDSTASRAQGPPGGPSPSSAPPSWVPPPPAPAVFGPGGPAGSSPGAGPFRGGSPQPPPAALGLGPTVTVSTEEWLATQQRLRALERQLVEEGERNSRAMAGLQARVRSLEAQLEAAGVSAPLSPLHGPGRSSSPLRQSLNAQFSQAFPPPPLNALDGEASSAWLNRSLTPGSLLTPGSPMLGGGGGGSAAAGRLAAYAYDNGGTVSPRVSVQLPGAAFAGSAGQQELSGPTELRSAYREALAGAKGGHSDMHLLRLMQRSGPCWNALGYELCCELLGAFIASLQARADGPLLPRMLPWLWRLADEEHNRFEAPHASRGQLLAGLKEAMPLVTDPQTYEKMGLLVSTLQTIWSMPEPPASARGAPAAAPGQGSPLGGYVLYSNTPQPQPPGPPAGPPGAAHATVSVAPDAAPPLPAQQQQQQPPLLASPEPDMGDATPPEGPGRNANWLRARAAPSINTLMGNFSNLQNELAALQLRGAGQGGEPGTPGKGP